MVSLRVLRLDTHAPRGRSLLFTERSAFLTIQKSFAARKPRQFREICIGIIHALGVAVSAWIKVTGDRNMKIEKSSQRGKTAVRLSGHFQAEHIAEVNKQLEDNGTRVVLDLTEVTVVDVEVVRFFGACEANGVKVVHCPRYIREWISRERET
jgi:hypothetical protein